MNYIVATRQSNLNVRSKPAKYAKVIGSLPKDSIVKVVGKQGEWHRLSSGGWVSASYLKPTAAKVSQKQGPVTGQNGGTSPAPPASATTDELFQVFVEEYGADRVHRPQAMVFSGQPGHHYFMRRQPTSAQLARITQRSRNAEASLIQINETFIVRIGNRGVATATLTFVQRSEAITHFRWIAHTHPLEQNNEHQSVAEGATDADRRALARVAREWNQMSSVVILCREGRVVRESTFHHTTASTRFTPGP